MPYGDPYSNINSIVGQGYAQDASIRGQGIDQASALTQHFMDAFMRQRQMDLENKRMAQMQAHQQAQDTINQQRAVTYDAKEKAYDLLGRLRQRNITQGELDKNYTGGNEEGLAAESNFYAQNGVPALNVPQPRTVGATPGTPDTPGTPNQPPTPGAFGMPDTLGAMGDLPKLGEPADPGRQVYDTLAGRQVEKQYQLDQNRGIVNDLTQQLRDIQSQNADTKEKKAAQDIIVGQLKAKILGITAGNQDALEQSLINQRGASAASAMASAGVNNARAPLIPGLMQAQTDAAGALAEKRTADTENIPILNAIRANKGGGKVAPMGAPPVERLNKDGSPTTFKNGQVWKLQNGTAVRVQ